MRGDRLRVGIVEVYCGASGKMGFYNNQEIGIARALKKRGYQVIIFYPDKAIKIPREKEIEEDIKIVDCPAKTIGVHSFYDWDILCRYSIDLVQIGSDDQMAVPSLVQFCQKQGILFYHYLGAVESCSENKVKRWMCNILSKRNLNIYKKSKCFVKTGYLYKRLKYLGVTGMEMMPVGLDLSIIPKIEGSIEEVRQSLGLPIGKQVILFVGRIDVYKKPMDFIRVMERLDDRSYYVIIGDGALADEFKRALSRVESSRYRWIKQIPNKDIHKYYLASDYFLNLNREEIFGMSILEAMYQGCTVIAMHAPGPDMIIENERAGFLTDSVEEMVQILTRGDKIKRKVAREHIMEHFIWDKTVDPVCRWIEKKKR